MTRTTLMLVTAALALGSTPGAAQDAARARTESRSESMDDHMMGPWKEMNAFHRVMGATWHPASQKGDLGVLRSRGKDLLKAAEAWAGSKPPAVPVSCGSVAVTDATSKVVAESKALLALLDSGADDARLKAALKSVHDAFEVAEKQCGGHGEHGSP